MAVTPSVINPALFNCCKLSYTKHRRIGRKSSTSRTKLENIYNSFILWLWHTYARSKKKNRIKANGPSGSFALLLHIPWPLYPAKLARTQPWGHLRRIQDDHHDALPRTKLCHYLLKDEPVRCHLDEAVSRRADSEDTRWREIATWYVIIDRGGLSRKCCLRRCCRGRCRPREAKRWS